MNKLLILGNQDLVENAQLIAFDLDHTLIKPIDENSKFITAWDQWKWQPGAFLRLIDLNNNGYRVVIFTNQRGIGKLKRSEDDFIKQINKMFHELSFQPTILVAKHNDKWRKPSPAMWWYFRDNYIDCDMNGVTIEYIGDALGRETDFSDSDMKFAHNCGFKIVAPEEYFRNGKINNQYILPPLSGFNIETYMLRPKGNVPHEVNERELIIIVGPPSCGKSSASRKWFPNYKRVNQDTINKGKKGTRAQCIRMAKKLMLEHSVVIDNTNPSVELRAEYVMAARYVGINVRCVYFDVPDELCKCLNVWRSLTDDVELLPDIAHSVYRKKLTPPHINEGFDEIFIINWFDFEGDNLFIKLRF